MSKTYKTLLYQTFQSNDRPVGSSLSNLTPEKRGRMRQRYKLKRKGMGPPFDGAPRFALITVNYSTTRYLKLMLLTLAAQSSLKLLKRIILVDNGSRDGGSSFLRELAERINITSVVHNRWFLTMRAAAGHELRDSFGNQTLACGAPEHERRREHGAGKPKHRISQARSLSGQSSLERSIQYAVDILSS